MTAFKLAPASIKEILSGAASAIKSEVELTYSHPELEARLLLEFVLEKNHAWLITHNNEVIEGVCLNRYLDLLNQRLTGKPIAYILGTQAFWDLNLKVNASTLIPRQDTECLIETVLTLPLANNARTLDLGTGTGAIALALAKENPNWTVIGLDKVPEAVELAKENAILNQLKVDFLQSDWFSALTNKQEKFDLIVSNPPYVEANSDYLQQGDLRFEPLSALVSGDDGLADIRMIIQAAPTFLNHNAYLVFEHGHTQSLAIQTLLCEAGFVGVKSCNDYNNLPRVTYGYMASSE